MGPQVNERQTMYLETHLGAKTPTLIRTTTFGYVCHKKLDNIYDLRETFTVFLSDFFNLETC